MKRGIKALQSAARALLYVIEETVPPGPDRAEAVACVRSAYRTGRDAIRAEADRVDQIIEAYCQSEADALGDRLVFDPEVSTGSPIIKGTFVTVSDVGRLLDAGMPVEGILKYHPEISGDDIKACIDYEFFAQRATEAA